MKRLSLIAAPGFVVAIALGVSLATLTFSGNSGGIAQAQGLTLAIDADITNGTRPCDPVDDTATVQVFTQHTVAVCVSDYQGSPDSFELEMTYSEQVSLNEGVVDPGTSPYYLDANPDANDGAGPNGLGTAGWTCDPVPGVFALPTMGPPAYVVCATLDPSGPELTADPGLLATFTFTATAIGTDTLSLTTRSNVLGDNCEPQGSVICEGAVIDKIGCPDDLDCDGVLDAVDNCLTTPNPGQENADAAIDNGPGLAGDDTTVPNGDPADAEGDACETDGDIDNDGLPDTEDTNPLPDTGICAAFADANDLHPNPAGGDITNDDDGDGDAAAPMGSDAADEGPSWDTDNDGVLDSAECILGYSPRHPGSNPTSEECGGTDDSDGDGLLDAWETCGWGTDTSLADSDGDTLGDCLEAADVTGNGILNYTGDVMAYGKAVLWDPGQFGKTMDFDLDKNGTLNFTGDVIPAAKRALGVVDCQ